MLKRFALAPVAALLLAAFANAQPTPPASETRPAENTPPLLTIEQCVAMALDKNFDLRIQRIDTESAVNTLEIARAEYDPSFSANANRSYSRSDLYGTGNASGTHETDASVSVSQKIITGATLQLGYAASRRDYSGPSSSTPVFDPAWGSGLTLRVTQPLLKNFGSTVNKAAIERARLSIDRSNYDLKSTVLSTIRSVEDAYYNLDFVRARLEVRKFSLEVAQKLLEENKMRRQVGTATNLDVLQAEVGVATAQRDIIVAQKAVNDAEDALLSLINPFQFEAAIGPLAVSKIDDVSVSFARSYKLARDNSPSLASTRLAIKQSEIDLAVAKRNRLPQLDLVGAAGYDATRGTFGRAFNQTLSQDDHDWSVGATLTYPWGRRRERANLANAKASLDSLQVGYEQLDQNVLVQVRTAVRSVQTSDEGVRITTLATKLSEQQYELEKARYDQGLSTFRRVQEAKEDYDTARLAEIDARVNLRLALAELARLETTSLNRYNVQLGE
ncbi:outer membrane protein [Ereboglobus sp. PH5-5]|uniref:TolC family protein n=1 Tax=unclassified Ereboglobus TaxID=2626932 RepID=UPI0024058F04|nr:MULTISPECIES: TolC family protein [unclassified Ereboglobus]MDF9826188.1 outer membrane protein [Ereboglobus sp. PH5-10]MDF9832206.1 outer membrane protein [Ereboglobus sp. PH5-5]